MPPARIEEVKALARQLDSVAVLPLIGAGGSYDCGVRLAVDISRELYRWYRRAKRLNGPRVGLKDLESDLGAVADAIYLARSQQELVEILGLNDRTCWPDADGFTDHFCGYRALARLVREGLVSEALTFNYDCGFEHALKLEGFQFGVSGPMGRLWQDHATVVADAKTNASLDRRGAFVLTKAHGCAARYRHAVNNGEDQPEEAIIIRWSQLLDWRTDLWARDVLADRARRHVLLLLGFSAQDPVIHIALRRVLEEVYEAVQETDPRVVVVDPKPGTLTLRMLLDTGMRRAKPARNVVTKVGSGSSLTAVILLLLTELLALRLEHEFSLKHVRLPSGVEPRLTALTVAAPAALRWTFLLRRLDPARVYAQRINLEQAARGGYVPLTVDPQAAAEALRVRALLRQALGRPSDEPITDAVAGHGFVVAPSLAKAYMPTGMTPRELREVRRPTLERAKNDLPMPRHLERVLVGEDADGLMGVSLDSAKIIPVP